MSRKNMLMGSVSAVLLISSPVFAQEAYDDEIIVTAQKRSQNILDVPVAVSAFNDAALETANVTEFSDLTRISPSLTINGAANKNESTIAIRGVGTFSFSTSAEPSVSVVVDGVAVVQQGQAFSNLNDIERVEVLRGPQGTLFGKNASAGVINIVTKNPSDVLTGSLEGTATTDGEKRLNAMLSGPLGDTAGFRVNGYVTDRDGYIDNLETGNKLNGEDGFGVRGKLTFEAGAADITLIAEHNESDVLGSPATYLQYPDGSQLFGRLPNDVSGIEFGVGNDRVRYSDDPVADSDQTSFIGNVDIDLGFATLSSVSSYQNWGYEFGQDVDGTDLSLAFQGGPYDARQYTQEFRLTSPSTGTFEYLVGLYFADAKTDRRFERGPAFRSNWDSTASTKSYAAFTQLSYHLSDETTLSGGARLNKEEIGVRFDELNLDVPVTFEAKDEDTAVTGKVSLLHNLTPSISVFGSVATGYKGQAYDISSGFNQRRADNPVNAETSVSYELGMRGRAVDNRLLFSVTPFWTDYKDFQAQSARLDADTLEVLVELNNVGKLRTKGVEFEGSFEVAENFDIFGSAAYTDAEITDFPSARCYPGQTVAQGCIADPVLGNIQDLAGQGLANSPEFKFTLGSTYETPVNDTLNAFGSLNYSWQSDVNYDLFQNPTTVQDSYGILNGSIGLKSSQEDIWKATLFVNNLLDKQYSAGIGDSRNFYGGNVVLTQQIARNYSRYFGLRVKAGF